MLINMIKQSLNSNNLTDSSCFPSYYCFIDKKIYILKIFSFAILIPFRKNNSSRIDVYGILLPCCKKSIYQDIVLKTEESSTYQELNLADTISHNTATRWSANILLHLHIKNNTLIRLAFTYTRNLFLM